MAVGVTDEDCSHEQDTTTAHNKTAGVKQEGHTGCSQSESSEMTSDVNQVLVEATAIDCGDAVDIANAAVAISSLENGTVYVLQPLESSAVDVQSAQNIEYRTLRLLSRADGDEDDAGTAAGPAVLVAASAADVISGPADLAHFLRSAGIADVRPDPANQPACTA